MRLDFLSGKFDDQPPTSLRTVQDLSPIWHTQPDSEDQRVVYRTYGMSGDRETAELLYATTVIEPGDVNGERFMTRGHFHTNPERGEWMLTLAGQGKLVQRDRAGNAWTEDMTQGTVHLIDGAHAHRVANTGETQLVFVVVWLADCGHDYEAILREGFGLPVMR